MAETKSAACPIAGAIISHTIRVKAVSAPMTMTSTASPRRRPRRSIRRMNGSRPAAKKKPRKIEAMTDRISLSRSAAPMTSRTTVVALA